ncbi:lipoprotein-releasing ABC transporter ATP-binding protein LolD [Aquicella lusitana]|uniref:Lipoprotein-releasing system ATP-binding protein LolD n=1 Tax=Aquicella lusitana TaxID=254246 RepID=A0A370GQM9_9COXI|nr:lipoprotein-releasing ABC transporter ATP-binding protein LolD [Aquicella lusitana]RDI46022.1 lipoprotein-releasing system ATP-binding protein [Aquicella lusitana]VVC73381.1 Lipoprotein-releasing system ATP-binding protein LolD [Aquicella lusitana]
MNNPVLACYNLGKTYLDGASKIEVLHHMDLEIGMSEMVAIVGTSGSGKSTFLHLLGGLDRPTHGRVMLNGKNLHAISETEKCKMRNRYLGFVYQFHHLLPEFSALENVGMPLLIRGDEPAQVRERAAHLLEQVGLQHRMQHRLGQLSGGERQRVAIARALVAEPLCVLADEPTGNLDPHNAEKVLKLFFDLQSVHKTSVVMVTHDPDIASQAQRVLRIEDGKLVEV